MKASELANKSPCRAYDCGETADGGTVVWGTATNGREDRYDLCKGHYMMATDEESARHFSMHRTNLGVSFRPRRGTIRRSSAGTTGEREPKT